VTSKSFANVAKLNATLSVFDFLSVAQIADVLAGTLLLDVTVALQSAITAANTQNKALYCPAGKYKISSTLECGTIALLGDGLGTQFSPTITDGSAALRFTTPNSYWRLENITVWSDFSGSYRDCIGIQIGGAIGSSQYANRYQIKNVLVHGCKTGVTLNGFIGEVDIFVQFCETGINGYQVNAANVRLKIEQCVNAGAFLTCVGSNFHVLFEGGAVLVNGFNWDDCLGCTWLAPYLETEAGGVNLAYFMRYGATTECRGVKIVGGSTFGYNVSDAYWIFDKVDGLDVNEHWVQSSMAASLGRHIRTTTNTKQINTLGFWFSPTAGAWLTDNSLSVRSAKNLVCNSNFRAGFKGFRNVGVTASGILSVETTITRGSGTAVKVATPAGATSSSVGAFLRMPDTVLNVVKGKTVWLGAWVFVPDITEYDTFINKSPAIAINDGVGAALSVGGYLRKGAWNFVHVQRAINSGATELTMLFYPMNYASGYTATGNEYIVVGEVILLHAPVQINVARVASGYSAEDGSGGIVIGQNVIIPGTDVPTGSSQTWAVGDRVLNSVPVVGQPKSWVCTVAGAPGTWESEGNL